MKIFFYLLTLPDINCLFSLIKICIWNHSSKVIIRSELNNGGDTIRHSPRTVFPSKDNGVSTVQEACGEGPWERIWFGRPLKGTCGAADCSQLSLKRLVSLLGGKLYHVTASLRPQMLSLMAGRKNTRNTNSLLKKSNVGYHSIYC